MKREKHHCKDCENLAYGFCIVHKAKISGHTFTDCADFAAAENPEPIPSQRERREIAEHDAEMNIKNKPPMQNIASEYVLRSFSKQKDQEWRLRGERERKRRRQLREDHKRQMQLHEDRKKQLREDRDKQLRADRDKQLQEDREKYLQFLNDELARMTPPGERQHSQNPTQATVPTPVDSHKWTAADKNIVYAMNIQEENILDRYIEAEKEKNTLREQLDLIMEKLQFDSQQTDRLDIYIETAKERDFLRKRLDRITNELKTAISMMKSYPTSDITAQRYFVNYMYKLLEMVIK